MEKDETFDFYKGALTRNLSSFFRKEWTSAMGDKDALFDISLSKEAMPYMATAIYEGWGPTMAQVESGFPEQVNGGRVLESDLGNGLPTIRAAAYFEKTFHGEELEFSRTAFYGCGGEVSVKPYGCNDLHVSNGSSMKLYMGESSVVWIYVYDESSIDIATIPESSKAFVIRYSDRCTVRRDGNGGILRERRRDVHDDIFGTDNKI